jgi:hypothetical protein
MSVMLWCANNDQYGAHDSTSPAKKPTRFPAAAATKRYKA